jgi:hypothetical protein
MFVTWHEQLSPIQFDPSFQVWRSIDFVRLAPCFVACMVRTHGDQRRTSLLASDVDVELFLASAGSEWLPDSVTVLIPPHTLEGNDWRAVRVTAISRPRAQQHYEEHPLIFGLADGTQIAGLPMEIVSYPDSDLQLLHSFASRGA